MGYVQKLFYPVPDPQTPRYMGSISALQAAPWVGMQSRLACENPVKLLIYLVYCTLKYKQIIAKLGFSLY